MDKFYLTARHTLKPLALTLLIILAACGSGTDSLTQVRPTSENVTEIEVDVIPTPTNSSISTVDSDAVNQFINSLTSAGATVVNNGYSEQGLFPIEDTGLWHLTVDGATVTVYEFSDKGAREAVSSNISPRGNEYTVNKGASMVNTTWDSEGLSRWWALDRLLVHYAGLDEAVIPLLTAVLGQPFADGSQAYRPEPNSGAIAGIDEYGVSFQYDPYLAAGIQPAIKDAFTDDSGMNYLLLPQHLTYGFVDSYADSDPLFQRYQLNLETMPQVVIYPVAGYSAMHPLAGTQVKQLQTLLKERPIIPGGDLPYLPLNNAAQVFHSQLDYLEFKNGSGVRYVTAFAQGVSPLTNQDLIYTFQGLTNDGRFYVAAFFPLKTLVLSDTVQVDDWEAFSVNYSTYVAETKATLNNLTPLDFTPDLALLDAVATSLQIEPDVELKGSETSLSDSWLGKLQPRGIYQIYDGDRGLYRLYRVEMDGSPRQIAEQLFPLLPSPDAARAVYMDDDHRLWLIDLNDGQERQLAKGSEVSWPYVWGDAHTLLLSVIPSANKGEGPAAGNLATLDIGSDQLQIIEADNFSHGRPAMSPNGQSIAFGIYPSSADVITGRIYQFDSGDQGFDPATFAGLEEDLRDLYNPAWSPNGKQLAWLGTGEGGSRLVVFDLVRQTAMTVFTWQPAQFGALPPSPVWSPDGKWLAIEIWANNDGESGLWILPADGTLARLHIPTGHDPIWQNPSQLFYADLDQNMNGDIKLVDLDYGDIGVLDVPAGSTLLLLYY